MSTPHRLYRSRNNRLIAGVAGGIAEYTGQDATIIRLILLAITLAGGAGLVAYIIAWIIMPEAPAAHEAADAAVPATSDHKKDTPAKIAHDIPEAAPSAHHERAIAGYILIVIGSAFLLEQTLGVNLWRYSWPIALIVIGTYIIVRRRSA